MSLPGPNIGALAPWMGFWESCLREIWEASRGSEECGLAGLKLIGTKLPGLTSLKGYWGLSGPEKVGSETPREHFNHN